MSPSTETSGKPEDIPQDVWDAAMRVAVEMEIHAAIGSRTDAKAALIAIAMVEVAARAILAAKAEEREACAQDIARANLRLPGIETTLMRGDNLAVTLCTHFDDGEPSDDDTGWSPAATAGYEQTIQAIREHYAAAIRKRGEG